MNDDVRAEAIEAGAKALWLENVNKNSYAPRWEDLPEHGWRAVMIEKATKIYDAMAPLVRAQAGRDIADAIEAEKVQCTEPYHIALPRPSCPTCARNGAFNRAEWMARGAREGTRRDRE